VVAPRTGLWRQALDGVRTAAADRVLRPALALIAAAAAFLLPVSGLLVPLLARQRQWPATAGGAVAGALAVGTAVVATTVLVRGAARRPGAAAILGLLVAAGAVAALAVAPGVPVAIGAGLVAGVGTGLFSAHVAPLVLGAAPDTHLGRVQAVLVIVQSVPLLVTNNVLGGLADAGSASVVLLMCAGALSVATIVTAARSDLPAVRGGGPAGSGDLSVVRRDRPAGGGDLRSMGAGRAAIAGECRRLTAGGGQRTGPNARSPVSPSRTCGISTTRGAGCGRPARNLPRGVPAAPISDRVGAAPGSAPLAVAVARNPARCTPR
jgi:hypothetical protein